MLRPKWAYCLSEDEYEKLCKIIAKVAGLADYLSVHDGLDLCNLLENYSYFRNSEEGTTPGMRINMSV